MNRTRSIIKILGKIEGLPVATVLVVLIIAFMITAPDVFLKWRIYMSFLQTVAPPLILGLGFALVLLAGLWLWLWSRRPGNPNGNGYV